jgi:transcriptional regulator with XRE-family HTH domain
MMNDSYSDIGDLLRSARKEMRLSIGEAASRLHIRPHYLELLEAGEFKELPGISYAKGYLARYAAFLRLDKDEVLRRFERVEDALGRRGFYLPLTFSKEKKPTSMMVWGALVAALTLYFGWSQFMPQHGQAPLVDSLEKDKAKRMAVSAEMLLRNPCLVPAKQLYPACYWEEVDQSNIAKDVIENEYRAAVMLSMLQSSIGKVVIEKKPQELEAPEPKAKKAKKEEVVEDEELPETEEVSPPYPGH